TTSGSPPVFSISLSDQSLSVLVSSFFCTSAHARFLWRFICFSKRAFNVCSSSSRSADFSDFLLAIYFPSVIYVRSVDEATDGWLHQQPDQIKNFGLLSFFNKLGFKFHCADSVDLAVDVMVAFYQPDILDFGSDFHHQR